MLLVVSSITITLIKLFLCDEEALSVIILSLTVAAAAPEMPGCMMIQREWVEIRTDTVTLIADFKKILIILLN